jgi:DNA gyrase subunit B
MPALIEKGFLYIAQPPLYKVKRGKVEQYINTDDELEKFLLSQVRDDLAYTRKKIKVIGADLIDAVERIKQINRGFEQLKLRYDPRLIRALAYTRKIEIDELLSRNAPLVAQAFSEVLEFLNANEAEIDQLEIRAEVAPGEDRYSPVLSYREGGIFRTAKIDWGFFMTGEYEGLHNRAAELCDRLPLGGALTFKNEEHKINDHRQVVQHALDAGRKGLTIQRYKGLGEMNPEQLWETTMDPEARSMLQVRIEDAIQTDQMFTVLMGDHVEPRRDFIEQNALNVQNLDI